MLSNGGFEGTWSSSNEEPADWTPIYPVTPGGKNTAHAWQGSQSLEQGQTEFDNAGNAGGYSQELRGLVAGDSVTVNYALWSDGGDFVDICHSSYVGTVQLLVDPCEFENLMWNYVQCDNVPITDFNPRFRMYWFQVPCECEALLGYMYMYV